MYKMSEKTAKKFKPYAQKRVEHKTFSKKRVPSKYKSEYNQKFKAPLNKKRKNEYDPEEEARLEKIVFGDPSDIINNLLHDEDFTDSDKVQDATVTDNNISANNNAIDQTMTSDDDDHIQKEHNKKEAWVDEDDVQISVQEATKAQNRRLPDEISNKLYKDYLQNKYKQIVGTPKWAELRKPDKDSDDLDNEILKHSCHLEKPKIKNLPKGIIDIKALNPVNKQTHTEGPIVTSLQFHPSSTVALVAGTSGILSLFQVDGIENSKLHTMQFKKFPISAAKFLNDGTEVIVGSQYYAHCHSYNLMSGKTYRIPLPHVITNMKKYEVSPDGKLLAVCGRLGEIFLLTTSSKELVGTLKMNAKCRAVAFTPDSKTLITHGDAGEMYVWDVNSRACIHRAIDDGCLSCESIATSPNGQFLATGSREGVVNLYDIKTVLQQKVPIPLKICLNLVTSITSLKFNSYSEILAMASDKKHNAFKMMHLPSFTVFSNFPTFQTNMTMPETIDFSPGSGYLGVSNRSFSAFLYRLKHYGNY